MKYLLAALGGFALTSFTFAGGVALAILYLSAEPAESGGSANYASLEFPSEAVKVDAASQNYERIGELPAATAPIIPRANVEPDTDPVTTAALSDGEEVLSDEHVAWCSARYRSYQVEDNSYKPYRGGRRECVSPYYDASDVVGDDGAYQEASLQQGASVDLNLNSDFVADCMSRYRSYRVEDNTYQPYGGGARVQCQ